MRILAKIWLITVSQYSFDALADTKFKYNNVVKNDLETMYSWWNKYSQKPLRMDLLTKNIYIYTVGNSEKHFYRYNVD